MKYNGFEGPKSSTHRIAAIVNTSLPTPDELQRALDDFRRRQVDHYAARPNAPLEVLLGESPAMGCLRAQVHAAAQCRANVLVNGPSGWELREVAHTIHYRAHPQGDAPLVRLDAAAARPDEVRRALSKSPAGSAVGGTLLIESIDRLPAAQQAELLTGLASPEWQGQVIATCVAPNRASPAAISDELQAAVSTIVIRVPPLADRLEDLPLLATWYLQECNRHADTEIRGFTDDALDRLVLYDWPGELAELRSVVQAAERRCEGPLITARDLPRIVHVAVDHAQRMESPPEPIQLDKYLAEVETLLIQRALALADGNKAEAARLLGMSRPRLYRRLVQLGLAEPPRKPDAEPPSAEVEHEEPAARDEIEFLPLDNESQDESE